MAILKRLEERAAALQAEYQRVCDAIALIKDTLGAGAAGEEKPKRRMSAKGRRNIQLAMKRRWKAARAAAKVAA